MNSDTSTISNVRYGYTLLELLMVVSIMALIFTGGFASYRDYQRRQFVESAARQVKTDLHLAQEYSLSGRKPEIPVGNTCETSTLMGYEFVRISTGSYRIDARCSAGAVTVIGPVILPTGIQMAAISGTPPDILLFRVLGRGVNRDINTNITLTQTESGVIKQITVSPSGEIR